MEIATWRSSVDNELRGKNHKIVLKKVNNHLVFSLALTLKRGNFFAVFFWRALSLRLVSHICSLNSFPIPLRLVLLIDVGLLFSS